MIQPGELRLGNLVSCDGEICIISLLSWEEVQVQLWKERQPKTGRLNYIPLTQEWMNIITGDDIGNLTVSELERTSDSSDIIILSTIECYLHDDGFLRVCAYEYDKQSDDTKDISGDVITLGYRHIRFLHQLQNLYFHLSGKELEMSGR